MLVTDHTEIQTPDTIIDMVIKMSIGEHRSDHKSDPKYKVCGINSGINIRWLTMNRRSLYFS